MSVSSSLTTVGFGRREARANCASEADGWYVFNASRTARARRTGSTGGSMAEFRNTEFAKIACPALSVKALGSVALQSSETFMSVAALKPETSPFHIEPLTPLIGAEIGDIDLSRPLDAATRA